MVNDTAFAPERFMRCEEFCARCGISMPTLYGYWRQGIGPQSQKIGPKHRVILREDLTGAGGFATWSLVCREELANFLVVLLSAVC